MECGSYRGIKLLEHAMKVLKRIFEYRIWQQIEIGDKQFWFMKKKGTNVTIFYQSDAMLHGYMLQHFRLSVCLCVTCVLCIKIAKHFIEILLPPDSPIILVFRHHRWLLARPTIFPAKEFCHCPLANIHFSCCWQLLQAELTEMTDNIPR